MTLEQKYAYKLDAIKSAAYVSTRRLMETYVEEYAFRAGEETEVYRIFAEAILSGVAKSLNDYFDKNEVHRLLNMVKFDEGKKMEKPTLREAQRRVALISGQEKLKECTELENEAAEKFCILMDWEITPEEVSAYDLGNGNYEIRSLDTNEGWLYNIDDDSMSPLADD